MRCGINYARPVRPCKPFKYLALVWIQVIPLTSVRGTTVSRLATADVVAVARCVVVVRFANFVAVVCLAVLTLKRNGVVCISDFYGYFVIHFASVANEINVQVINVCV